MLAIRINIKRNAVFACVGGAFLLGIAHVSFATDVDSKTTATLDPVVISATRSPRPLSDVAGTVTVIDARRIDSEQAQDAADLVRYEPGLAAPSAGSRFGTDGFSIRGIGGNRVAIEVDGVPVGDQFDVGSFSNATRDLIDTDLVKRIEVLRGPASTLYGSDALGGVVSYTTWDPADLVRATNTPTYMLRSGYFDDDGAWKVTARAAQGGERFGALASATYRRGSEADSPGPIADRDLIDYDQTSGFAKLVWQNRRDDSLALVFDGHELNRDSIIRSVLGAGRFRSTTGLHGDDIQRRKRVSAHYDFALDNGLADAGNALIFWNETETDQQTLEERAGLSIRRERLFEYRQRTYGASVHLNRDFVGRNYAHRLGYGIETTLTQTKETRTGLQIDTVTGAQTDVILGEHFPVRDFPVTDTREIGAYVHDEISGSGPWTLIPALRFDWYDLEPRPDAMYRDDNPDTPVVAITERAISPKMGLLFDLEAGWSLFGQYSHGFRAPPFEDANIGLEIPLFNFRALPNPDLKSERSDGLELGLRKITGDAQFILAGYYTDYKDFIETKVNLGPDPVSGTLLFQSQNISSAHIYGAELRYQRDWSLGSGDRGRLHFDTALNWTRGRNDANGEPLNSVDPAEAVVKLGFTPASSRWNTTLYGTFVHAKNNLDQTRQPLYHTSGYGLVDLVTSIDVTRNLQIYAAVYNLTNKHYWRWADTRNLAVDDPLIGTLAAPGRNFAISFSLDI